MSEETKEKLRKLSTGNKYGLGYRHSEESKRKMSISRKGRKTKRVYTNVSEETRNKMKESHKGNPSNSGKIWVNNGKKSTLIFKDLDIPEGWQAGRIGWKQN